MESLNEIFIQTEIKNESGEDSQISIENIEKEIESLLKDLIFNCELLLTSLAKSNTTTTATTTYKNNLVDIFKSKMFICDNNNNNNKINNDELVVPIKPTNLFNIKQIVLDMYNLKNDHKITNETINEENKSIEGYLEILPKYQKNSILLTWKKRYFKLLNGMLNVYDEKPTSLTKQPRDTYKIMGGKVEYETNRVINIDDSRGNNLVLRCNDDESIFHRWKCMFDKQILDNEQLLWMNPGVKNSNLSDKKVLIIDLGTCSVRAGLYSNETQLPRLFFPTVCVKDSNNGYKIGFDAFNTDTDSPRTSKSKENLIFPLKSKNAIDKSGINIDCIESIVKHIVDKLNINPRDFEVLLITPQKFTDKVNIQFLSMFLEKLCFESAILINQALLVLYSYNSPTGVIVNLSEKIDIIPMNNGIVFQNGVTNLACGGSTMSQYLNSYVSRAHYNYLNDVEQYLLNYVKEKSCYIAANYTEELQKPIESLKWSLDLNKYDLNLKKVELDVARFQASEGLFNPEIWGMDGQGIHKLILKAIQSCSMDLRREMARSIYLAGGMSRIHGLVERLEKELKTLLPASLNVKINCSTHSYHCSYLGAFKFITQPEYEKLSIKKSEWLTDNVNCLRKWRMF